MPSSAQTKLSKALFRELPYNVPPKTLFGIYNSLIFP